MADVELRATKSFSYATRRLTAGQTFTVSERDAKILIGIKRAEPKREPGNVAPPPAELIERAAEATPRPDVPDKAPTAVPAMRSQRAPASGRRRKAAAKK